MSDPTRPDLDALEQLVWPDLDVLYIGTGEYTVSGESEDAYSRATTDIIPELVAYARRVESERDLYRAQLKTALADVAAWKRRWSEVMPTGPDLDAMLHTSLMQAERDAAIQRADNLEARIVAVERERDQLEALGLHVAERSDAVRAKLMKERDAAIERAALAEGKLRETTYAALAAREQGEADAVAGIVAHLRAGARLARSMNGEVAVVTVATLDATADDIEAGAWRGKEGV